jgi:EAL domain-containing protein (putative c-di-GMP-specific phosphodiesterase class I)
VEAADHCPPLIGSGCALGQGYHFAKPLTTDEAADLLLR